MPGLGKVVTSFSPPYVPNGVVLGGSVYGNKSGSWTSVADSKLMTFAATVKFTGTAADQHILGHGGGTGYCFIGRDNSVANAFYIAASNTSGTQILFFKSGALNTGQWYNILFSCDMASTSSRWLYIDDSLVSPTYSPYTNAAIEFTTTNSGFGNDTGGGAKFIGELADVWFDPGRLTDFSVTANRRLFFTATGAIVDKGTDGSRPFSAIPRVFFSGATASWHTNKASGGGTTLTNTLTTSAAQPLGA